MIKRSILAVVAIFITWSVIDFVIHGVLLAETYEATADLWRPMEEMKTGQMYALSFVIVFLFTSAYGCLVSPKSLGAGLKFGLILGLIVGGGMGFGSHTYLPIPMSLALSWFAGVLIEYVAAGAIVGGLIKAQPKIIL
jgi:hypothetical protein